MTDTITPAAVRLMLHRCGLSQTEAALFLNTEARQVRRWYNGERYPSGELILPLEHHWRALTDLCARQDRAAEEGIAEARDKIKKFGKPQEIHIRMARSQADAETLGWPCPSAHVAVIRRMIEWAPASWRIVPVYPGDDLTGDGAAMRRTAH